MFIWKNSYIGLPPGSRVLVVSSGAAIAGAPLSGSYAGAKRMLWFMVPMQMIAETDLAQTIAGAYAKPEGLTVEQYVETKYGEALTPVVSGKILLSNYFPAEKS